MVLPAPAKIQAAAAHLDGKRYPDNPPEIVGRLVDALQSITDRLQSLEIAHRKFSSHASGLPEAFIPIADQMQKVLQSVFKQWARMEPGKAIEQQKSELQQIAHDLLQQFHELNAGSGQQETGDKLITDLYVMVGSARGLIEAMDNTQLVINQINWHQWATPQF